MNPPEMSDVTALVELEPPDLRSPAELIATVADRVPLAVGAVYAVLIHAPATHQTVLDLEELVSPSTSRPTDDEASALVDDLRERWSRAWLRPGRIDFLDLKVVTIIVREGRCGWSDEEWRWSRAWRYGFISLSGGYITVVTEHGWLDLFTEHADHTPCALPREPPHL